jgi:anti-sigma B factor antagonist
VSRGADRYPPAKLRVRLNSQPDTASGREGDPDGPAAYFFRADATRLGDSALVRLAGELDIATGPLLHQSVASLVDSGLRTVTVDLRDVTFADVAGLHALVDAQNMVTGANATFRLECVPDWTRRVIQLAGFGELQHHTS